MDIRKWVDLSGSGEALVDARRLERAVQKRMFWFGAIFLTALIPVYVPISLRYNNRAVAWMVLGFFFGSVAIGGFMAWWQQSYRAGLLWLHGSAFAGVLVGGIQVISVSTGVFWWLAAIPFVSLLCGLTMMGIIQGAIVVAYAIVAFTTQLPGDAASLSSSIRLHLAIALTTTYVCAYLAMATFWRTRLQAALEDARTAAMAAADAKARFLANMSHEIRTPLSGIIGAAELLQASTTTDAQRQQLLALQTQSANALLALVNDVLDWAKLDAGKLLIESVPLDLRRLVFEVNELFAVNAFNKNIELTSSCDPDVPRSVMADATRIRQIVNNLVSNAVKFTSQGGVHIHLSLDGTDLRELPDGDPRRWVRIEVSDTGIGIDPENLESLFNPFVQADASVNRKYGGTGLGLAICRELAELMGGRLEASSSLGRGSTFMLSIPLQVERETVRSAAIPRHRPDVVLITRSAGLVRHVKSLLNDLGCDPVIWQDLPPDPHVLDSKQLVLVDTPLMAAPMDSAAWLTTAARLGIHVAVMTPLNSDAVVGALPEGHLLYKPVRKEALAILLDEPVQAKGAFADQKRSAHLVSPHVLVGEDNPINQVIVQAMLGELGATSVIASNGREALDWLAKERFDLVLMDVQMPEMSGVDATRRWRVIESGHSERVPIVAMTANAEGEEGNACRAAGMDGFLSKPFNLSALRHVLDQHVHGPELAS